jgi:hypothetical protein
MVYSQRDSHSQRGPGLALALLLLSLACLNTACAPVKTLDVWKDDSYSQPLQKVLIIAVTKQDYIRNQFENVLANQLNAKGVEAIPSFKVLPQAGEKLDRDSVVAKVKELGIENVLVARSISKEEITNHQYGGVILGGTAVYDNGWYGYSYGYTYDRQYDTDYFTISTKLYDVSGEKPVWSYLAQVKVDDSRQHAVNIFVPMIVQELSKAKLLN